MIFVEHVKDNYDHLGVNVALIASFLLSLNKKEKHYLFSGKKLFINITNLLFEKLSISEALINIPINPYDRPVREYNYLISDFKIVLKAFLFARKNNKILLI